VAACPMVRVAGCIDDAVADRHVPHTTNKDNSS
jgi:hypothetical protein